MAGSMAIRRVFARPKELGRCSPNFWGSSVSGNQGEDFLQYKSTGKRTAHSEAAASDSRYGGHLLKVSDRIINVSLVSPIDASRHNLKALWGEGLTLLDALKRAGVDTGCPCPVHDRGLEVCMGNCAVLVATEWLATLPPRTEKETEILRLRLQTGGASPPSVDKHYLYNCIYSGIRSLHSSIAENLFFRLSCVLPLGPQHEGMTVGLTEPVPAETPRSSVGRDC